MLFKVPHKNDLSLDGQTMRKQMIENFTAIEKEINQIKGTLNKMQQKKQEDSNFFDGLYHQNGKKDKEE